MTSIKRISNEFKEIKNDINNEPFKDHRLIDIKNINDNDLYKLEISFLGPIESPYEELINTILIEIPTEYPNQAPTIKFINKIYHPNISLDGKICLDILKDNWRPIYTLKTIILSIISLLSEPNPDSPLNNIAAKLYRDSINNKQLRRKYSNIIESYYI